MPCTNDSQRAKQYRRYPGGTFDGNILVWQKKDAADHDGSPFFFLTGMPGICADGAPRCYGPDNLPTLDYTCSANRHPHQCSAQHPRPKPTDPGATQDDWPGIHMNGQGRPAVQAPPQPAPGYYVSRTRLVDPQFPENDQRRYIDSTRYPYFAMPIAMFQRVGYLRYGDFAAIINVRTSQICYAIFADAKNHHVFEGSIALADAMGVPASPRTGGDHHRNLLCVVFPGSGFGPGMIPSLSVLRSTASGEYFRDQWPATLADCYAEFAGQITGATEVLTEEVDLLSIL
jgi:hypothetical protein